jgi:plastocyanin
VGPDDALWFTEFNANKIGRITTAGAFHEYTLPIAASGPSRIAAGVGGGLWVTQTKANDIARVTPTGSVKEYPLPSGATPARIAAGPDGNVWFTEAGINAVGQITPSGTITQFPIPTVASNPTAISAGADGNVWFTEQGADKIARITVGIGHVTEYPIPTASSGPDGITFGANGQIWFSEATGNKVGYVTDAIGHSTYAVIHDNATEPAGRTVHLGNNMRWIFAGPNQHSVTDSTGMGLYDSGPLGPVSTFTYQFTAAGGFPYTSTVASDTTGGTIKVPLVVPATGTQNTPFTVTWSTALPVGATMNVQVATPGGSFATWQSATTALSGSYTPTAGPGVYQFEAQLVSGGHTSGWSPIARVTVS